jgi:hypothetical protein
MRFLPVAAAIVLALGAFLGQSVAVPPRVVACSCAGPPSLAGVADDPNVSIVAGTVGVPLPDVTPLAVDLWFRGAEPTDVLMLNGGTQSASSCDIGLKPGGRYLLVLYGEAGGTYSANMCAPNAMLGTPDGELLLAEVIELVGAGAPPPESQSESEPEPPAGPSPWLGSGLLWILAAIGVAFLLFAALAVVVTRRKPI